MNNSLTKSAKIVLLKSIFDVKNQLGFFSFENIDLGDHSFFLVSIFEPLYY